MRMEFMKEESILSGMTRKIGPLYNWPVQGQLAEARRGEAYFVRTTLLASFIERLVVIVYKKILSYS